MSIAIEHLLATSLTKERRRKVCIHEAAHAVIGAMGGAHVHAVAVAPVGAALDGTNAWTYENRRGYVCRNLYGICEADGASDAFRFTRWDDDEGLFIVDRARFREMLRSYDRRKAAAVRRAVRADICRNLAGPAADAIADGEEVGINLWPGIDGDGVSDTSKAEAWARLLPYRNEYEYAVDVTECTLRRPDVWAMVIRLADELEQRGEMGRTEESYCRLQRLLPSPIQNWPPSPRARKLP